MAKKEVTKDSVFKDEKSITYGENGAEDQITNENTPDGLDDETGLTQKDFNAAKAALNASADSDTQSGSDNKTPNVRNGGKKRAGGSVQGANLQTVTTVGAFVDDASVLHKDTLPQENDDKLTNRYLQRFLQNGDICEGEGENKKSLYAKRMVNEGKQFQSSKAVVKPFPDSGSAYLELLKQQGQFNEKPQDQPKPHDGE